MTLKLTTDQVKEIGELIAHIYIAGYGQASEEYKKEGKAIWREEYRERARSAAEELKDLGIKLPYPWIYEVPWKPETDEIG